MSDIPYEVVIPIAVPVPVPVPDDDLIAEVERLRAELAAAQKQRDDARQMPVAERLVPVCALHWYAHTIKTLSNKLSGLATEEDDEEISKMCGGAHEALISLKFRIDNPNYPNL